MGLKEIILDGVKYLKAEDLKQYDGFNEYFTYHTNETRFTGLCEWENEDET